MINLSPRDKCGWKGAARAERPQLGTEGDILLQGSLVGMHLEEVLKGRELRLAQCLVLLHRSPAALNPAAQAGLASRSVHSTLS